MDHEKYLIHMSNLHFLLRSSFNFIGLSDGDSYCVLIIFQNLLRIVIKSHNMLVMDIFAVLFIV